MLEEALISFTSSDAYRYLGQKVTRRTSNANEYIL